MAFTSYAQNCEDVMLWRALKDIENGFYIDVGAYSPDIDSVTRLFYENGWRGLNLEPNPTDLVKLMTRRPRDKNLGIAVSDSMGEVEFHLVENSGLSTMDAEFARRASKDGYEVTVERVPAEPLASLWDRYVPEGQPVHFLKIDVEGQEEAVIRGADWTRHRPWIVLAEATEPKSTVQNHHGWDSLLITAGYQFVWFDGLNRFYVAEEHAALAKYFDAPPNVFDEFRRVEELTYEQRALSAEASLRDEAARIAQVVDQNRFELERMRENLSARITAEAAALRNAIIERLDSQPSPLWIRLMFHRSGQPKKALRQALFHNSGKPRGVFRNLVLKKNGTPRSPFRAWMSSSEYQGLRAAVPVRYAATSGGGVMALPLALPELSTRANAFVADLEKRLR